MATSLKKSKAYWDARVKAEKAWQESAKKDMEKYNQHIVGMYNQTISDINQQIKADLALSEGKLVKADAMKEYESLAKRAVDKANALRAKGKHVTRKDFSEDVNNRLKVYNATMRINRNEIIKSKIGARLVGLGIDQEQSLTNKLWNDYIQEKERQAGILGITTKSNLWTSKEVQEQIAGQIAGANFSKRIWADIDGLKGQLDGLVSSAVIRGESPQQMAKWLTGMVSSAVTNQEYAAERLARTEMARVQFEAQKKSIIDTGYKYVKWIAEGSACKVCREIAYKDNGYDEDGVYKANDVPDVPVHPNCMCSISAHWIDDKLSKDNSLEITDISDFSDALQKNYGISVSNMDDVSPKYLNYIYKGISETLNQYPQVKKVITEIVGYNDPLDDTIAANALSWRWVENKSDAKTRALSNIYMLSSKKRTPKNIAPNDKIFVTNDQLEINKYYIISNDFDENLKKMIKEGWMTPKDDYSDVIKHEMGHALMSRLTMSRAGIEPAVPETGIAMSKWLSGERSGAIAKSIQRKMEKAGHGYDEMDQFVGKYGKSAYSEWFAELYSDKSSNPYVNSFKKYLDEEVKKRLK